MPGSTSLPAAHPHGTNPTTKYELLDGAPNPLAKNFDLFAGIPGLLGGAPVRNSSSKKNSSAQKPWSGDAGKPLQKPNFGDFGLVGESSALNRAMAFLGAKPDPQAPLQAVEGSSSSRKQEDAEAVTICPVRDKEELEESTTSEDEGDDEGKVVMEVGLGVFDINGRVPDMAGVTEHVVPEVEGKGIVLPARK